MRIVFRADASVKIGSGHIMRCLTLADALASKKMDILFVCRELPGNLCSFIEKKGYPVCRLPYFEGCSADVTWSREESGLDADQTICVLNQGYEKTDWLIADHYGIERVWETRVKPYTRKIMVIDDLANREHCCDVILDQNYYDDLEPRYHLLVPTSCKKLLGPEYVLLRDEFITEYHKQRIRTGDIRNILIFFGGSDPTNETPKALRALAAMNLSNLCINVVTGASNIHRDDIQKICGEIGNCNYYCQVNNMAEFMSNADLAIGSGGTTTWERCFLGLPAITVCIAENQTELLQAVAKKKAVLNLGWYENVTDADIQRSVKYLMNNKGAVRSMGIRAAEIIGNTAEKRQDLLQTLVGE